MRTTTLMTFSHRCPTCGTPMGPHRPMCRDCDPHGPKVVVVEFPPQKSTRVVAQTRNGALPASSRITLQLILSAVAQHFGVSKEELIAESSSASLARERYVAMYLIRQDTPERLEDIGKLFKRTPSLVTHGCGKIQAELEKWQPDIDAIRALYSQQTQLQKKEGP